MLNTDFPFVKDAETEPLPLCGYSKTGANEIALFGDAGKRIFLKNEHNLSPPNSNLFQSFARSNHLPIIMNFVEANFHLEYKKDLDQQLSYNTMNSFGDFISDEITEFWNEFERKNEDGCLFDALIEFIIRQQLKFFFKYDADSDQVKKLAYFEDYYAFGLYLSSFKELSDYYSFQEFNTAKSEFECLYNLLTKKKENCAFSSFLTLMEKNNYDGMYMYSQFYNVSVAGSTNVAKAFVHLLDFCSPKGIGIEIEKLSRRYADVNIIAGKLISELYRCLPYVDNQIVPPYIVRVASNDIALKENFRIKKNDLVLYYHLLNNLKIPNPMKFDPNRTSEDFGGKSSPVFGAGLHRCCGASLTDLWLHHLLVGYLKSGIVLKSEKGLKHTTYNPDFEEIKKVTYMVKASKDEKY